MLLGISSHQVGLSVEGCDLAGCDVASLLATSGQQAFFEPSRGYNMGPVVTEWQQQLDNESHAAYLARCLTLPADYGLVVGGKQLGKRVKHDPSTPVQRLWRVESVLPLSNGLSNLGS